MEVHKMDIKEAVKSAKQHVVELFEGEGIYYVGLEEVKFETNSHEWLVTVGFERRWDRTPGPISAMLDSTPKRTYKLVRIDDENGEILALKDGFLPES